MLIKKQTLKDYAKYLSNSENEEIWKLKMPAAKTIAWMQLKDDWDYKGNTKEEYNSWIKSIRKVYIHTIPCSRLILGSNIQISSNYHTDSLLKHSEDELNRKSSLYNQTPNQINETLSNLDQLTILCLLGDDDFEIKEKYSEKYDTNLILIKTIYQDRLLQASLNYKTISDEITTLPSKEYLFRELRLPIKDILDTINNNDTTTEFGQNYQKAKIKKQQIITAYPNINTQKK